MNNDDLKQRTKQFALRVIRLSEAMPRSVAGDVLTRQVVRSGTSVAANYRSACRAKSRADFVAKMGIVEEEADETGLWLELITEAGFLSSAKTAALRTEAGELTAIAVASIRTARGRAASPQSAIRSPQSK
jgi:four helix bundle protein